MTKEQIVAKLEKHLDAMADERPVRHVVEHAAGVLAEAGVTQWYSVAPFGGGGMTLGWGGGDVLLVIPPELFAYLYVRSGRSGDYLKVRGSVAGGQLPEALRQALAAKERA